MKSGETKVCRLFLRLLRDRNSILIISIVLGLAWGEGARWTKNLILPALALIMTFSVMDITGQKLSSVGNMARPAFAGILMSYVVLTGTILGLSSLLVGNKAFYTGFVIIAAVPPAVAVVPFAMFLQGDVRFSLLGSIGGYLAGLVLMPLIALVFLGDSLSGPLRLAITAGELILLPFVASRILLLLNLGPFLQRAKGLVANWGFFLVTYSIIAHNRDVLLKDTLSLIPVFFIAFASTILLGWVIEVGGRVLRLKREITVSLLLLGTLKNYGLAGGLALSLFDKASAVPAAVASVTMIVQIIYLELLMKRRMRKAVSRQEPA
jgi:bile acid:Na+ symporter, BASS family